MLQSPKEKQGIPNIPANELRALGENQTQAIVDAHVARDPDAVWGANSLYLGQKHAEKAISADPDNYLRFSKIYHEENNHRIRKTTSEIGENSTFAEQAFNGKPDLYKYLPSEVRLVNIDKAFAHDVKNIEHIPKDRQTTLMAEIVLDKAPELYYSLAEEHQSAEKLEIAVNKSPGLLNDIAFKGDLLQECYPKFKSSTRDNVEVAKMAVTLDPSLYLKTSPRLQKDSEFFKFTLEAAKDALNMGAPVNADYRSYPRIIQQSDIVANEAAKTRAYLGDIENIAVLLNAYKKDPAVASYLEQDRFDEREQISARFAQLKSKYEEETKHLSPAQQVVYAREKEVGLLLQNVEGIPFVKEKLDETIAGVKGWRGASEFLLPSERWEVWLTEKGKEPDLANAKAVAGLEAINPQKGFAQKNYEQVCAKIGVDPYGRTAKDEQDRDYRVGAVHLANFFEKDLVSTTGFLENTLKQEISSLKGQINNTLAGPIILNVEGFSSLTENIHKLAPLCLAAENSNLKSDLAYMEKLDGQLAQRIKVLEDQGLRWAHSDSLKMEGMLFCQVEAINHKILGDTSAVPAVYSRIAENFETQANLRVYDSLGVHANEDARVDRAKEIITDCISKAKDTLSTLCSNLELSRQEDKGSYCYTGVSLEEKRNLAYLAATYDEVRQLPGISAPALRHKNEQGAVLVSYPGELKGVTAAKVLFNLDDNKFDLSPEKTQRIVNLVESLIANFEKIPAERIMAGYGEAMKSPDVLRLVEKANASYNIVQLSGQRDGMLRHGVEIAQNYESLTKGGGYGQYTKDDPDLSFINNPHSKTVHDVGMKTAQDGCNLQGWRSLAVQAPGVLAFARNFKDIEVDLERMPKNFAEVKDAHSRLAYPKEFRSKDPELATWCARHQVSKEMFMESFDHSPKTESSLPLIVGLKEDHNNQVSYKAHFLDKDDRSALFIGDATSCCQTLGSAGSAAAISAFEDKTTGTWVVTDNQNKVVAQSWVREGTLEDGKKALILDSIESEHTHPKMVTLVADFVRDFSAQARDKGYEVQIAVTNYGMTSDVSKSLGATDQDRASTLIPLDSCRYSDAGHESYSMAKLHERTQSVQPFDATIARQAQEEKASMVGNLITAMENKGMGITAGYAEKLIDASLKSGDSKSLITVEGANLGKMQDFGTKKFAVPAGDILKIAGVSSDVIDKTLSANSKESAPIPLKVGSAKELQAQLDSVKGSGTKAVGPSAPAAAIRAELSLDR